MAAIGFAGALMLSCYFAEESRANFLPCLSVDRSNEFTDQGLNYPAFSPIGESFTPTLDGIQWAAFGLQDSAPKPRMGAVFDVELFQGVGTHGSLLATSAVTDLPSGFGDNSLGEYAYFYFVSEVTLSPGTPYTLILERLSGEDFFVLAESGSQVGDQAILMGKPQPNLSLTFGEGIFAVREPSSLVLAGFAGRLRLAARMLRPVSGDVLPGASPLPHPTGNRRRSCPARPARLAPAVASNSIAVHPSPEAAGPP